jgi:hypothetical protein
MTIKLKRVGYTKYDQYCDNTRTAKFFMQNHEDSFRNSIIYPNSGYLIFSEHSDQNRSVSKKTGAGKYKH